MRTARNQLVSSSKRVVTETLHFYEIGEALAIVKSHLNFRSEIIIFPFKRGDGSTARE